MKKIISLLIVLAMLMVMAPAVLAAGSGTPFDPFVYASVDEIPAGFDLAPYQEIYIQAPACGATVTLYDAEECTELGYQHPMTGMFFNLGSTAGTGSATAVLDENNGFFGEAGDPVVFAIANRSAASVTVGLVVAPASNSDQGGNQPAGNVLALGNNAVVLAAGDADGETYTFTATEAGTLNVALSALAFDQGFGMEPVPAQFIGMALMQNFVFYVNGNQAYDSAVDVEVAAGDEVTVQLASPMMRFATEATLTLSMKLGDQGGDSESVNPGDYFPGSGTEEDPYIIVTLEDAVQIMVAGGTDIYYKYLCEGTGSVSVSDVVADGILFKVNDEDWSGGDSVDVRIDDVLMINIWSMNPSADGSATVAYTENSSNPDDGGSGGENPGGNNGPITGTASADEDSKFVYSYTATENGTLTITVGDGTTAWVSDVMDFGTFSIIASASDTAQGYYTCDVVAGDSYGIRIYGAGEPCAAISNIPYSIVFTPSDAPAGPQLEDYKVSDTQITEEGTIDVTVAVDEAEVTLYNFEPGVTGQFKIELVSGDVAMALWSNNSYTKIEDAENGVLTVNITDPNQSYFIALAGEGAAAQLKVTKTGAAESGNSYPTTNYVNKDKPAKFDATADDVTGKVDITDSKVDTAVLGKDGYYHLNSEDGEILFVDFKAEAMNLIEVWKNGSTSYAKIEGGKITEVIKYQDALAEYLKAEVKEGNYTYGNSYHPLTADLIEMLKNIGENNGWYGENGMVGKSADAWMFACVTMKAKVASPETGDFGVIAAAIALGTSAVCGTAVIVKKKEN